MAPISRRQALLLPLCAAPIALLPRPTGAARSPHLRVIETRHYRIHTDLDSELANDLAQRLEAMYEVYSWRLRLFTEDGREMPRFEVYLYRRQQDYLNLTGIKMKHTGGVFIAGRNLLASFLDGQGRNALRRTLQHEAFHQFAHTVISPNVPVWLNEGLAQVFEEAVWHGSSFDPEQVPPRRIRQLQTDLQNGRLVKFDTLMKLSPMEWAKRLEHDQLSGATQYNQSWAMVYFLINARDAHAREAADGTGGFRYRHRLLTMLELLHEGKDADGAFHAAFGRNIDGFEKRFHEYARLLQPTPLATLMENLDVVADLMVELKKLGKQFDTADALLAAAVKGKYRLTYTRGATKWTTDDDVTKYFCDPAGRPYRSDQLFFQSRRGAPLPDLVCRYSSETQFRTRFYVEDKEVQHEVLVEPVPKPRIVGAGKD